MSCQHLTDDSLGQSDLAAQDERLCAMVMVVTATAGCVRNAATLNVPAKAPTAGLVAPLEVDRHVTGEAVQCGVGEVSRGVGDE
jgi:hypothetical protein